MGVCKWKHTDSACNTEQKLCCQSNNLRGVQSTLLSFHRKLRPVKEKASGVMRSSQRRSLLARGTKAVLPKQ